MNHITLNSKNSSTETKNIFLRLLTNTFLINDIFTWRTRNTRVPTWYLSAHLALHSSMGACGPCFSWKRHMLPFFLRFQFEAACRSKMSFSFSPRYFFFFSLNKMYRGSCHHKKTERKGKSWHLSHQERLERESERSQIITIVCWVPASGHF